MEETIYHKCLERVRQGADFKVDFIKRSMTLDGKYVIKEGKYEDELGGFTAKDSEDALSVLKPLYGVYRLSRPTKRSIAKRHTYFEAMTQEELESQSKKNTMYAVRRDVCQFELEFTFLSFVLQGVLKWNPKWGSYYYKDPDSSLRIQREWIEER